MQLLSPVAYRYWTRAGTRVVLAGVPFADAEETFERQWADRQEVVST